MLKDLNTDTSVVQKETAPKKGELNSSPFSNVNPQTHNVRSVSDVKYCEGNNLFRNPKKYDVIFSKNQLKRDSGL